jgi:Peptidase family M23
VPQLIFPLVGATTYTDDFGDPRGQGVHEGIDILAAKRTPVVAVEAGKVKFHTTSARAGCMLYLYGESGTTYLYVHLNNDLTKANDNTGRCVAGVSYAKGLDSGDEVAAGEPIAFNGDSGDADGIASHLHFEVHPADGEAVNPYPHLRRAKKLLFAVKPGSPFTAALRGSVVDAVLGSLTLDVEQVQSWPGGLRVTNVDRKVELVVPPTTVVFNPLGAVIAAARLEAVNPGHLARAWTEKAPATLEAQLGQPLTLSTERVELLAS